MGAQALSSRAIIGMFRRGLENLAPTAWVPRVSMQFLSDQASETYKWLGQVAPLKLWEGERIAKGLRDQGITIENAIYEATLEVKKQELVWDHTGQIQMRINGLVRRAMQHWAKLVSDLINDNGVCYDGQNFYDTDHVDLGAKYTTNQSNAISVDISALPVPQHGTTTAPSVGEAAYTIMQGIRALLGFKDNEGEPFNDGLERFLVMCPISLWDTFAAAAATRVVEEGGVNPIQGANVNVEVVANSRLTATAAVYIFGEDAEAAPFIRQSSVPAGRGGMAAAAGSEMVDVEIQALAEGSDEEVKNDRHLYGVKAVRAAGYGFWQNTVRATMT